MTLFSSLDVFVLFRVMAHWFGRLPLPCCRVIGIFTQELVLSFQVSVDSSNYNMTAIVLVAFPVFRTKSWVKLFENFIQGLRFILSKPFLERLPDFSPVVFPLLGVIVFSIIPQTLN